MMKDTLGLLYNDRCSIYGYEGVTDEITHRTVNVKKILYEDIACRLSYKKSDICCISDGAGQFSQVCVLFISPDIQIKQGMAVEIVKCGCEDAEFYKAAGKPKFYPSHQEIELVTEEIRS